VALPGQPTGSPAAILRGLRAQRSELENQLEQLTDQREEISSELTDPMVRGANREGLEARIRTIDQRIGEVETRLAANNLEVARAAGIPGAVEPPQPVGMQVPEEVFAFGAMFVLFILFPLTLAYARRLWKRTATAVSQLPGELMERLTRIEQAVDAIAIEVERVGEGQRYVTGLFSEQSPRALGAGAAQPLEVKAREAAPQERR
jgi:hypothetical protein